MKCDESTAGGVGLWDVGQLVGSVFCVWLCFRVFLGVSRVSVVCGTG
jgi:hypothetical protein